MSSSSSSSPWPGAMSTGRSTASIATTRPPRSGRCARSRVPVLEPRELGLLEAPQAARGRRPTSPGPGRAARRATMSVSSPCRGPRTSRSGSPQRRVGQEGPGVVVQGLRSDLAPGLAARRGRHQRNHVDRRVSCSCVLRLRLGERRLAVHAPVNGLRPLDDPADGSVPNSRAMVAWYGRHHRLQDRPSPKNASRRTSPRWMSMKRRARRSRRRRRFSAGSMARRTSLSALSSPELPCRPDARWATVAIQAGHVDGIVAASIPDLTGDLPLDLVERGPHVDVPFGVRRPSSKISQGGLAGARTSPIKVAGVPGDERLRLAAGRVAPHGEVGAGEGRRSPCRP